MNAVKRFLGSMAGRMFLILILGMVLAAFSAVLLTIPAVRGSSERYQRWHEQNLRRSADNLEAFVARLEASDGDARRRLLSTGTLDVHVLDAAATMERWAFNEEGFSALLKQRRLLAKAKATAVRAAYESCVPSVAKGANEVSSSSHDAAQEVDDVDCHVVKLTLSDGTPLRLGLTTKFPLPRDAFYALGIFWVVLLLAVGLLAYGVARLATRPLSRLADAASQLGEDLQREPIALSGPQEVRRAVSAFNAMQQRLQRHMSERTQMLAAITHDLQTPLTRLRLRLEKVEDEGLREKLVADLAAMQALIREGLDLARSVETSEKQVPLDLDSLLESLVEDAADAGGDAKFVSGCGSVLELRPLAVRRLFANLIDNALKYAGSVEVAAAQESAAVVVRVRDRGPGLPADELEAVFEPFHRLESSRSRETGGSGLGLTIARTLAEKNGATLTLRNRDGGGVEAQVRWPHRTADGLRRG